MDKKIYEKFTKGHRDESNPRENLFSIIKFRELKIKLLEIRRFKNQFNEILGFLPFLWSLELFMSTCFRIAQIAIVKESYPLLTIIRVSYEYIFLTIIYLIYFISISYFQSKRPTLDRVLIWIENQSSKHILSHEESIEKLSLIQHVISIWNEPEYVAWNMFNIDRRFLVGFLSAVITFSVMLIQLLQKTNQ
jgi:hypothetical protein